MNSLTDVWGSVLQQMSQQLAPTTINTWFDEVDVVTMEDSAFVLHCGNEFKKKTIETRFLSYIRDALRDLFSADFEIKILNDDQLSAYHGIKPDYPGDLEDSGTFTFETYVVGPSNKLAYAAAHAVSDRPGVNYNPLFIYGDSGLGKTHLLYAIAHGLKQNYPDAKVVYIKGDDFTNELVASIREGKNAEFREKYRQATLLLVDDVQFIAGKESTQEEFFHTFNHLHTSGKQIIISSDKPPKDIETLEARLRTRFEWGLIADISSPNYETRMAILQKKIELDHLEKYNIPNDVLEYIATNVKTNIRELEGSLNKLIALYKLNNTGSIDIALAAEALKDIISSDNRREVTPELILDIVSEHFGVSISDLKGNKRNAEIVFPRQIAMYLIRNMTETSLKAVGVILGGKDHSTIKHGIEKIENELKADETLSNTINIIKKKINPA